MSGATRSFAWLVSPTAASHQIARPINPAAPTPSGSTTSPASLISPSTFSWAQENTTFDEPKPNITPESGELLQLQRDHRVELTRDRDWRPFNGADQLRAELAELRFPWPDSPVAHQPNNLPLASIGKLFKGRDSFLDELRERLGVAGASATAIVNRLAVHGLGGVGKTRAAVEFAWRHADD